MGYRFEFRPYQHKFVTSLMTSHGSWDIREGIIVRLTDETGKIGWGEIAPISWFGSETLEQALEFCRQLPEEITQETIFSIPDELSACQFGFESAWETNRQDEAVRCGASALGGCADLKHLAWGSLDGANCRAKNAKFFGYSALLPAGEAALESWQKLWKEGYRTFKWKIGVYPIAQELEIFELLSQILPASAKLRLDANGGLRYEEAQLWLKTCDNIQTNEDLFSSLCLWINLRRCWS
jgi:o-succinylbenzoate synthase